MEHIFPVFNTMLSRAERERRLGQRARVLWFTGLSGSGKSTLAVNLERQLIALGYFAQVLDGDNVRTGLNGDLGFSEADRHENIRRIAEVARLWRDGGVIAICSFVSPMHALRELARQIIGPEDFLEIYVSTPLAVCEQRDVKGLYQKARAGLLPDFTGVGAPYEPPEEPWLTIPTQAYSIEACLEQLLTALLPLLRLPDVAADTQLSA